MQSIVWYTLLDYPDPGMWSHEAISSCSANSNQDIDLLNSDGDIFVCFLKYFTKYEGSSNPSRYAVFNAYVGITEIHTFRVEGTAMPGFQADYKKILENL